MSHSCRHGRQCCAAVGLCSWALAPPPGSPTPGNGTLNPPGLTRSAARPPPVVQHPQAHVAAGLVHLHGCQLRSPCPSCPPPRPWPAVLTSVCNAPPLRWPRPVAGLLTLLVRRAAWRARLSNWPFRRLPRLKLLWIGLTWAVITALWPVAVGCLQRGHAVSGDLSTWCCMIGERALGHHGAHTRPLTLRDRKLGPCRSMKTLPQLWGTRPEPASAAVVMLIACDGRIWLL